MNAQDAPVPSLWQVRFRLFARGALPDLPVPERRSWSRWRAWRTYRQRRCEDCWRAEAEAQAKEGTTR